MSKPSIILGESYVGTVIDSSDLQFEGKVRLKIPPFTDGIHKNSDFPIASQKIYGAGQFRVPRKGESYYVKFSGGPDGIADLSRPILEGPVSMSGNSVAEHQSDYDAGTVNLAYDHTAGLRIGYSRNTGILNYLGGSSISIRSDGDIDFTHSGNSSAMSFSGDDINMISTNNIILNGLSNVDIKGNSINLEGENGISIKGDTPGECAVNGNVLKEMLIYLSELLDEKYPSSPGVAENYIKSKIPALLNEKIRYT